MVRFRPDNSFFATTMASWRVLDIEHLKTRLMNRLSCDLKTVIPRSLQSFLRASATSAVRKNERCRVILALVNVLSGSIWDHVFFAGQQHFKGCWAGTFHHRFLLSLLMQALEPHHPNRGANMPTPLVEPLATFHLSSMWAIECPLRFDDIPSRLGESFKIDDLQSNLRFIIKIGHRS